MKRPTFFILGAAKAGTTSLYYYLSRHPEIYMSSPKEPLFFEAEYGEGLEYYCKKYFKDYKGQKQIGEARQRNLYLPFVCKRIRESVPEAKFIVICRHPVERAFSHYWYLYTRNEERLSFKDVIEKNLKRLEIGPYFTDEHEAEIYRKALNKYGNTIDYPSYIDSGYYAEQIQRYIDLFGSDRVKVLFFEDLADSTEEMMVDIFQFLGLDPIETKDFSPQNQPIPSFVSGMYRTVGMLPGVGLLPGTWREGVKRAIGTFFKSSKPQINLDTKKMLVEHFRSHNAKLSEMTGRNLDHWNG